MTADPEPLDLTAPVCVFEAEADSILAGIPKCVGEMVAVRRFNVRAGRESPGMPGVIPTGELWRFLLLAGNVARVDIVGYNVTDTAKVFGILTHITGA